MCAQLPLTNHHLTFPSAASSFWILLLPSSTSLPSFDSIKPDLSLNCAELSVILLLIADLPNAEAHDIPSPSPPTGNPLIARPSKHLRTEPQLQANKLLQPPPSLATWTRKARSLVPNRSDQSSNRRSSAHPGRLVLVAHSCSDPAPVPDPESVLVLVPVRLIHGQRNATTRRRILRISSCSTRIACSTLTVTLPSFPLLLSCLRYDTIRTPMTTRRC